MICENVFYIGVNDHEIDLFEGQYKVPNGMAYNSYLIKDNKTAVFDCVDVRFSHEWLDNIQGILNDNEPDYIIISHVEPDHSGSLVAFLKTYSTTKIVSSEKAFVFLENFFGDIFSDRKIVVKEGASISLGAHNLTFYSAPMVHWPEVMVTYEHKNKMLFSADAFGKFGALDVQEDWACEARRYYFGIVGKYGVQVQNLLKKLTTLEVEYICPLHGPILKENISSYVNLYNTWSSYGVESDGIMIAYTSVYGNTAKAVELLASKLKANNCPKVVVCDLAREDMAEAIEDAFRYGKLVLATTTYNADIFPFMRNFIDGLVERGYKNRTIAFLENGTWAPMAAKIMRGMFDNCKNLTFTENVVTINSSLKPECVDKLDLLAKELCGEYLAQDGEIVDKNNFNALFNIGYGLYVVTSNDGKKDNGLIVNSVTQVTNSPNRIAVTINKDNYSHHTIKKTGVLNLNCLSIDAPFSIFENFGFKSGRTTDKFTDIKPLYSDNGLAFLPKHINSFISLKVQQYVDLETHGMFVCDITEARVVSNAETMTYNYYQENVKPRPNVSKNKGFACKVCGYIYEGETLPQDFICPLCKHGASDFEKI